MKIALFFQEKNHYPLVQEIINLKEDNEIHLYAPDELSRITNGRFTRKSPSLFYLFLKAFTYDKIIIDEQYDIRMGYLMLFIFFRKKTFLVIHNVFSWFKPLVFGLKIKHSVVALYRKMISEIFNQYIVVNTRMKELVLEISPHKKVLFIPFGIEKVESIEKSDDSLLIVVPGTITKRRKYDDIVELMLSLSNSKLEIVLLGRPNDNYGRDVISKLKTHNLKTFDSFIPDQVFADYVNRADIILSDIPEKYITDLEQNEKYGYSKATGVSFLMLKYCKPGLLPNHFEGMREMESQILRFEDYDSLKRVVENLIKNREVIRKLKSNAVGNWHKISEKVDML